jgi:peptidoglycan hydrolase CwlO-like protein
MSNLTTLMLINIGDLQSKIEQLEQENAELKRELQKTNKVIERLSLLIEEYENESQNRL